MSDHDALLAGVLANPDADLPRLVYADFIEENGDALRAEFIRVQCALAGGFFEDEKEKHALLIRAATLRDAHGEEWLEPLKLKGEPLSNPRSHGLFRRGFVEIVWMPATTFAASAERLFACSPVSELRVILGIGHEMADVVNCPSFLRLRGLDISDARVGQLAAMILTVAGKAKRLAHLRRLRLRQCGLTDLVARAIGRIEEFNPKELDLTGNPLSAFTVDQLRERYGTALIYDESK